MSDENSFYNRPDWPSILSTLSPWRDTLEQFVPKLHYLGLLTNLMCILVFAQKRFISRKGIYYLALMAFADLMYNFTSVLPTFLISTHLLDYHIYKTSNASCFFYDYAITASHFYSVLLTLFITKDRFDHINKPLNLARKFNNIYVTLSLLLAALIIALPHGFLMVYIEKDHECDARPFFRQNIANTSLTYYQLYFTFTEPLLFWLMPGIVITHMNFYVIFKIFRTNSTKITVHFKALRRSKDRHANTSSFPRTDEEFVLMSSTQAAGVSLGKSKKTLHLGVNQYSHYLTIVIVGFYFILSTIPYGIVLSLQNNLTLQLKYDLATRDAYLNDHAWIAYGHLREWAILFRIFFMSNHCFNFFLYVLFNRLFRRNMRDLFVGAFKCKRISACNR